jgi:hypothetical protein
MCAGIAPVSSIPISRMAGEICIMRIFACRLGDMADCTFMERTGSALKPHGLTVIEKVF